MTPPTNPTPLTPGELDELAHLDRAAFRAPWVANTWDVECPDPEECCGDSHEYETIESPEEYPGGQVCAQVTDKAEIKTPGLDIFAKRNAALIAAARNALPRLLEAARLLGLAEAVVSAAKDCEHAYEYAEWETGPLADAIAAYDAAKNGSASK